MKTQLMACWRTGELVGFHRVGDDPAMLLVGAVADLRSASILFRMVEMAGRPGGDCEVPYDQIQSIQRGTAYLVGLAFLAGQDSRGPRQTGSVWTDRSDILIALKRAMANGKVLSLSRGEGTQCMCLVRLLDDGFVVIEMVANGLADGTLTLRIQDLTFVREESEAELREKILFEAASAPF